MNSLVEKIFDRLLGQTSVDGQGGVSTYPVVQPVADAGSERNPYEDSRKAASRVLDFIKDCDRLRWSFERLWFRSVLYYLGNQWLTWDARSRRWREKKLRKWVPKPVTNRYASTVDTIVSAIQATKVMPSAWPATSDPADIGSANVADRILEVISDEIKVEDVRKQLARWMTLCGDAFAYVHYDKADETLGMVQIPNLACAACGATAQPLDFAGGCPQCGTTIPPIASLGEGQQPEAQSYPKGRMTVEVLSPLEVYLNPDIPQMAKHTRFTIARSYSLQHVKAIYGEKAANLSPDTSSATRTAQYFMEALAFSTEDSGYNLTGASHRDRVTIYTHVELPSDEYPQGLHVVMAADETVLELGESPHYEELRDGSKQYYLPLVKFGYEMVPGRLYSKTPAYDLISKQDQLNRLESLIEMSAMKGVYVTWLLPVGSSVSETSGEPGQRIRYTPTGSGGYKPEVITTSPFPDILLKWKEQIQADFEELGGTFDALKGNVPRGVSAGYAIQLLTERSYGRFASVFADWEQSWVDLYSMSLKMFRTYVTEARIRKLKGASGGWEIQSFKNSDLQGSVDLRIEGAASKPRSKLAEQALIESLAKLGVVNPADPEQRYSIAQMFGMSNVLGVHDEDVRYAAGEWEALLAWNPPLDPVTQLPLGVTPEQPFPPGGPVADEIFDNHVVHIAEHRKPTRSDVWQQLPQWKKLYWKQHQLTHLIAMQPPVAQAPANLPKLPSQGSRAGEAGSKANETNDNTMGQLREGGSVALGSGGHNQY
jgi:hypothetical protein